jgi:hypothetical protein
MEQEKAELRRFLPLISASSCSEFSVVYPLNDR